MVRKIAYNQREDGRYYTTQSFGGAAVSTVYSQLDELPQAHSDRILMLLAGCNGNVPFMINGVGRTGTSRQIFVDGYDAAGEVIIAVEDTRQFELWFDDEENVNDTN